MKLNRKLSRAQLRSTTRPLPSLFNVIAAEDCAADIAGFADAPEDMLDALDTCVEYPAGICAALVAGIAA